MRIHLKTWLAASFLAAIAGTGQAAVWERPAGAYTPTNHSVNTTKYQIDRSNGVAISSAKVDGDVNKAFQGLNSLEDRVPPSVIGQGGKYLTTDGAVTSWGLVSSSAITSGAAASGLVLKANGSGSSLFGLLDATSFSDLGVSGTYTLPRLTLNTAGQVIAVTSTNAVSVSSVSGTNISATNITTTNLTVSGTAISTSLLPVATGYISTTTTGCSILKSSGFSGCTRIGTGNIAVSFTTPMADAFYKVICTLDSYQAASWVATVTTPRPNLTSGFFVGALNGGGVVAYQDSNRFMCVVYP